MVQDMRLIELKGCGKTTMLRIIGGFEFPTTGQVMFEGKDITRVPPYRRRVNTVFQKYALFPHMNVFDNVAFGLTLKDANEIVPESRKPRNFVDGWLLKMRHRHALKKEIAARVNRMLRLVRYSFWTSRWARWISSCAAKCSWSSRLCSKNWALPLYMSRTIRKRRSPCRIRLW